MASEKIMSNKNYSCNLCHGTMAKNCGRTEEDGTEKTGAEGWEYKGRIETFIDLNYKHLFCS